MARLIGAAADQGPDLHRPDGRARRRRWQIGLVDQVVPAAEVYAAARAWAEQFVNGPALALAAAKKAIDGGLDVDLRTGLDLEAELFAALFATEDRKIGMGSFVENGPGKAEFTGALITGAHRRTARRWAARSRAAAGW